MIELHFPNAVRSEADFFGRQPALDRIVGVLSSDIRRPVAIYGERRMGKTSLMNVAKARLEAGGMHGTVLLSPAMVGVYSLEDFARELLQQLYEFRGTFLTESSMMGPDGRFHLVGVGELFREVGNLLQASPARLHVICIDEFDAVLHGCHEFGASAEIKKVLDFAIKLIEQANLPLTFFLTLTRLPEFVRGSYSKQVFGDAETIRLEPLSDAEMGELIDGVLGDRILLGKEHRRVLFEQAGGHPYLLKALLANLVECLRESATERDFLWRADAPVLVSAIDRAASDARVEPALDNILNVHFTEAERQLVTLLASLEDVQMSQYQLDRLGRNWRTAAKELERRHYLVRVGDAGSYAFRYGFFPHWLRQRPDFEEQLYRIARLREKLRAEIEIDVQKPRAVVQGEEIHLTSQEHRALSCLCRFGGRLVERDDLIRAVWEPAAGGVSDAAVDAMIHRIREKLDDDARAPRYLETVPDRGFILHRAAFIHHPTSSHEESQHD